MKFKSLFLKASMLTLISVITGCQISTPVLLQDPTKQTGKNIMPLKIGIATPNKKGKSQITDIKVNMMFGIYQIDAKMPRRNDLDYITQGVADNINDRSFFATAYPAPFNPKNVDLIMQLDFNEYKISNATDYASMMTWPFLSLIPLTTLMPQDKFYNDIDATCTISTTDGKVIKKYSYKASAKEEVSLYAQPYGNYMWYHSIFRKEFNKMMDHFYGEIKKDKQLIIQTANSNKTN